MALACGCGPGVGSEDGGSSTGDESGPLPQESSDTGVVVDCTIGEGVVPGRVTVNGDAIEVMIDANETLGCGDSPPACGYELHRLEPAGGLEPGAFTVDAGVLVHHIESCTCCNGEGGPDESEFDYDYEDGSLTIEAVGDACVTGSFYDYGTTIRFVATRC